MRPGTAREVLKSWGWFAAADGFRTCGGGEAGRKATARKTPGLARAWRQRGPSEDGRNSAGFYQQERICPEIERYRAGQTKKKGQTNKGRELGSLLLPASTAAGRRAARLMDGGSRTQRAQTGSRRKILPRPNTERTGANRRGKKKKRTKERFGTCPNVIQLSLRHSQVSEGTAGTRRQASRCREEELIPPSAWRRRRQGRAGTRRQGRQRMGGAGNR